MNCAAAGSVAISSPAIQPSSAPPATTTSGKRSISRRMIFEPTTTSGIDTTRPKISSAMLPFAAPATPITLSRLITKSAIITVFTAPPSVALPSISWPSPPPSSGSSSLMPIHSSASAPAILSQGSVRSDAANAVSTTRRPIAPATPQKMPFFCRCGGRLRQASAITTALSPASRMSMTMIWTTATQNAVWVSCSQNPSPASSIDPPLVGRPRLLQHALQELAHLRGVLRHPDAAGLHHRELLLRRALAAGDDRAGVAHALAGRCGDAGDEAHHRLLHVLLHPLGGGLLVGAADLADH